MAAMGYSECSQAEVLRKGLKSLRASQDFAQRVVLPGVIGLSGVISALGGFVRPQVRIGGVWGWGWDWEGLHGAHLGIGRGE